MANFGGLSVGKGWGEDTRKSSEVLEMPYIWIWVMVM